MQLNRSVPDVQEERKKWNKNTFGVTAENLVFLDESGVNINFTRL